MVQPEPRKTKCEKRPGSTGSGSDAEASTVAATRSTSSPSQARAKARTAVAKRVWTTTSSSANPRMIAAAAARGTGEPATAESASVGVDGSVRSSARTTSVVVPEREIASSRSYSRWAGKSEAANASVSPSPRDSRRPAIAWATKYDVPQPISATRLPRAGSVARASRARAPARRQMSG